MGGEIDLGLGLGFARIAGGGFKLGVERVGAGKPRRVAIGRTRNTKRRTPKSSRARHAKRDIFVRQNRDGRCECRARRQASGAGAMRQLARV